MKKNISVIVELPKIASQAVKKVLLICLLFWIAACAQNNQPPWNLVNISGHLPDLRLSMIADDGRRLTEHDFANKVVILYFGFTHCPDVCPISLAKLVNVIDRLGSQSDQLRVLFVTVDPARDTPKALHAYVKAFDATHIVGATGSNAAIKNMAKRYRVAYSKGRVNADGDYEVTHSSAIYLFDRQGRARLIGTQKSGPDEIFADVKRLLNESIK